jgi:hypothetical protein
MKSIFALSVVLLASPLALAQIPDTTAPNLKPPPTVETPQPAVAAQPPAVAVQSPAPAAQAATGRYTYETPDFTVQFNDSQVSTQSVHNDAGTSVSTIYLASKGDCTETVVVRKIEHDISVDHDSSTFYVNDEGSGKTISNREDNYYQQHPYSYAYVTWTDNGTLRARRERFIIVNSRTVIALMMDSPADQSDQNEWEAFANSLVIK